MDNTFPPCAKIVTVFNGNPVTFDSTVNDLLDNGFVIHSIAMTEHNTLTAILYLPKRDSS